VKRDLIGDEKRRLFSNINLKEMYKVSEVSKIDQIDELWRTFYNIWVSIKDKAYASYLDIKSQCIKWHDLFLKLFHSDKLTPYLHVFTFHVWEMIKVHGDISRFTMQGLEKLNDFTTMDYFGATNKHHDAYLVQLIKKRNRMDMMKLYSEFEFNEHFMFTPMQ
jgi:hypothetical protein